MYNSSLWPVFLKSLCYREVARNGQQLDLAGAVVHNQRQWGDPQAETLAVTYHTCQEKNGNHALGSSPKTVSSEHETALCPLLWTKHEQASSSWISSELAKPIVYGPSGVMHFINPQIGNALNSVILNFEEWTPGLHFSVLPQVEAQWILHYNTKQQHTSPKAILNN